MTKSEAQLMGRVVWYAGTRGRWASAVTADGAYMPAWGEFLTDDWHTRYREWSQPGEGWHAWRRTQIRICLSVIRARPELSGWAERHAIAALRRCPPPAE